MVCRDPPRHRFSGLALVFNVFFPVPPRRTSWVIARKHAGGFVRHGASSWVCCSVMGSFTSKTMPTGDAVQIAITEVGYGVGSGRSRSSTE
jgi:hypothetical protein